MDWIGWLFVGLAFSPLLVFNMIALRRTRRGLRLTVPGWWATGSADAPRLCVYGRIVADSASQEAPLSGRACAAWRLSVSKHGEGTDDVMHVYDRYSSGAFVIETPTGRIRVELDEGTHTTQPFVDTTRCVPAWVLPMIPRAPGVCVMVYDGVPVRPVDSLIPPARSKLAEQVARDELARLRLSDQVAAGPLRVTETIVDFEREWVCEGPRREGPRRDTDGGIEIGARPTQDDAPWRSAPIKLAPKAELRQLTKRVIVRECGWALALDCLILLPPIIIVVIALS